MNTSRNLVILAGQLASEPKVSDLSHGRKMLRFRLNTPENRKKKNGERYRKDEYHNIVVYSQSLIQRLIDAKPKIGDTITVEGSIATRDYIIDGQKRYITEIVVTERNGDLRVEKETEKIFSDGVEKNIDIMEMPMLV